MNLWTAYGVFRSKHTFHCSAVLPWLKGHFAFTASNSPQTCLSIAQVWRKRWSSVRFAFPLMLNNNNKENKNMTSNSTEVSKASKGSDSLENKLLTCISHMGIKGLTKQTGLSCYTLPHWDICKGPEGYEIKEDWYLVGFPGSVPFFFQCHHDLCWAQHCLSDNLQW